MVQSDLLRAAVLITVAAAWVQGCILVLPNPPSPNSPNPPQTQAPNPWPDQPLDSQPTPQVPSAVPQQSSTRFFTSRQSTRPPSVTTSQATLDMMNPSLILNNASTTASFLQTQTSTKIPFTRPENSSISTSSTTPRLPTSGSDHVTPHLSTTNHYTTSTIPDWWWWFNNPQVSSSTATTLKSSTKYEAFLSSSVSTNAGVSESFTTFEYNSDFISTLNTPTTSFEPYYSTNELNQSTEESLGSTLEFTTSEDFTTALGSNSMPYTDETSNVASTVHWLDNNTDSTNEVMETTIVTSVENSESSDLSTIALGSSTFVTNGPNTEESEIPTMLQTSTNPDITTDIMGVTTFFESSTNPTSTPNDFSSSLSDDSVFSSDESVSETTSEYSTNDHSTSSNEATTIQPDNGTFPTKESPAVPFSTPMPNYPDTGEDTIDPQYLTSTDPNSEASNSECPPIKFKKPPVYCKDSSECKIDDDCKPGFSCCIIDPCSTKKCYETGGLERFFERASGRTECTDM